jgi:hypothetical protein
MGLNTAKKLEKPPSFSNATFEPGNGFLRGLASWLAVQVACALFAPVKEYAVQHLKLDRIE